MFHKKTGFPEESEVVLCTVKKILYHSVFVDLDEYDKLEGMIHISEISPGRIRNLRDFVKEGKKIVCKVLKVNQEKGHIDLSLRRVSLSVKKKKNEEYKQEQKSEKILETIAQELNTNLEEMYNKIGNKMIEAYGSLNSCFQAVALEGGSVLTKLDIPEQYVKILTEIIKEKIKPPEVKIDSTIVLKSNAPNGIEIIKNCLKRTEELYKDKEYKIKLSYLSAPNYRISLISKDYKSAEKAIEEVANTTLSLLKKDGGEGEFIRND